MSPYNSGGVLGRTFISSPELCSGWAIVITFRPSSVRPCAHPLTFSNDFFSEGAEPILLKFHMSLLRVGERKLAKMVAVRWPRWPPRAYMVKTFKNLLLQNRESLGAESLQGSLGTGGLPKLLKELLYVDVWPFYSKVKFDSLCIFMGKTFKNLLLQNRACLMAESLHIGNGRAIKIAKIMVVHWHLTILR